MKTYKIAKHDLQTKKRPYTAQRWKLSKKQRYIPKKGDRFDVYVITRVENGQIFGHDCIEGKNLKCSGKDYNRIIAEERQFVYEDFWFIKTA